jgi:predicted alpha/beta superfamily hydrolase
METTPPEAGRPGRIQTLPGLLSPGSDRPRDVSVHLPSSYRLEQDRRFPVIYMQDGQNLFDPEASFAGSWEVDEAVHAQAGRGAEAIVVGVPNAGEDRIREYAPWSDPEHGGGEADPYLRFLLDDLKPMVDHRFRTRTERDRTGIAGSSLGGLLSLYGFFRFPGSFGFVAALSPSLWFGNDTIFRFIEAAPFVPGRIYLDGGTEESARMVEHLRRLESILRAKGYRPGDTLRVVVDQGATHHESHWGRRFRNALPFLLNA